VSLTIVINSDAPGAGEAPRLTLDGARIVIGRSASSDVRLPDPSVSHRHAIIQAKGGEYSILDDGSTNGTWIAGVRLAHRAPRILRSGDRVRIGRVWLEVRLDQGPVTADLPAATRDIALALVARAMREQGDRAYPTIHVVEGPDAGATLALEEEGRVYRAGRGEACDLPLADPDASREHVQIVRRGAAVVVRDLGSRNGAALGDSALSSSRDVPWRSAVTMRVGVNVLALEEPVSSALGDLEACDDEPMSQEELAEPAATAAPALPRSAREISPSRAPPPEPLPPRSAPRKSAVSSTDAGVVLAALVILALSAAGLFWLLRP
jgi:hypothetical protein